VGDVVLLEQGNRVPADCLLIEEMDMLVDEKMFFPKQKEFSVKQCSNGENHFDNPDPTLLQGSMIMAGSGKAVVLAVGDKTLRETEMEKDSLKIGEEQTPMMLKLEQLGKVLTRYAYIATALTFCLFSIFWLLHIFAGSMEFISNESLLAVFDNIQIAIALLIVCVPEGLPLAVSMAMAFSTDKLKDDNLLLKNLECLEISGSLLDIMTGKTSTLTTGDMRVDKFYAGSGFHNISNLEINVDLFQTIQQGIILNSDARMEMSDETHQYVPEGGSVEVALMKFLIDNNLAVQE
jgi:magnesium-transporting ATPase (P-type)